MFYMWGKVMFLFLLIILHLPQFGQQPRGNYKLNIMKSKNYMKNKFQNKGGITTNMNFFKILPLLPKWFSGKGENKPSWDIPVLIRHKAEFNKLNDSSVRLTWFGHSAYMVELDNVRLFIDPMLGPASSPFSFFSKRFNKTLPMGADDLPQLDAVLFTHDHYDHLDYGTILKLKEKVKKFFVPLGVGSHLVKWGVDINNITEMDWWDEVEFNGLTLVCTPAQHFSGRGLTDRDKTLWCSYVIKGKTRKLFFNGDSGYFEGFKEISNKYGPFDICMMECGQYNELWKEIHMMPEETVKAHIDLKGNLLVPIHWGAFSLSLHKWTEPVERLLKAAEQENIPVATPMIGESIVYPGLIPNKKWWIKNFNKK